MKLIIIMSIEIKYSLILYYVKPLILTNIGDKRNSFSLYTYEYVDEKYKCIYIKK